MSTYDKLEESYEELFTLAIDWSRLKAILQSLDRKVPSKASSKRPRCTGAAPAGPGPRRTCGAGLQRM